MNYLARHQHREANFILVATYWIAGCESRIPQQGFNVML